LRPLCIYHGNCADGFGAAWVVRKALAGEVDFHAGVYQNPPPDVSCRDVILVDFSYKRPVLYQMNSAAKSLLILDHHKTAAEDLGDFIEPPEWAAWQTIHGSEPASLRVAALFDMNRSGAMIAWDYFFPRMEPPQLLKHIQDRDLWLFKLDGTREIQANVFSYPYDFDIWDTLMAMDVQRLRDDGAAIERKHFKDIRELIAVTKRRMLIGGFIVPVANLPYTLTSDAGNFMAQGEAFAACYWDTSEGRVFSLRSTAAGTDVSEIAKRYGGGGHRNAAGFRMPIGWEGDAP
jgi:oligoribonuclease NrnB/cAMP/cGMP phosphodiesterase (DHH superfamily)